MDFCPLPVVCGTNGLGKTKASKAALSLIGNSANFYARVNQRFLPRLCSRSSLPPVIDDVKLPSILEEVVMSSYDNGTDGTCLQETDPRTCPLLTVNYKTLDFFKKDPRYTQLHFDIELSVTLSDPTLLRWLKVPVVYTSNPGCSYYSKELLFLSFPVCYIFQYRR